MNTLYLCGAGNSEGVRLAMRVREFEQRWDRIVILDDDPAKHGRKLVDAEVIGSVDCLRDADPASSEVANLVARTTARRAALRDRIAAFGISCATMIHPTVDRLDAVFKEDVLVYEHCVASPEITIGEGSVVFMRAIVGHEATVGRCCVLAAGSVLNARVTLEDEVYVGTNASILPEVTVGRGATIGANTAVIEDVPPGATVIGVPGKVMMPNPCESASGAETDDPSSVSVDPEVEHTILTICQQLLGRSHVDSKANFFDLGVTSLIALQMLERVRRATNCDLNPTDVFQYPSPNRLARHVTEQVRKTNQRSQDLSPAQLRQQFIAHLRESRRRARQLA